MKRKSKSWIVYTYKNWDKKLPVNMYLAKGRRKIKVKITIEEPK